MKRRFKANGNFQQRRKKLFSVTVLLLTSAVLLTSATYAWFVLSTAPQLTSVETNVSANGSLEIALGKNIGKSAAGDSYEKSGVRQANRTWGNLVDLSDESYGLQSITLLPAVLNAAGGAVDTLNPLAYPVYGPDGRVEKLYTNHMFTGVYNGSGFVTSAEEYGVRGIGLANYEVSGAEGTFGPLSQRQEIVAQVMDGRQQRMQASFQALCKSSQSFLMDYCYYGTDVSASALNLTQFSENVDAVVSSANEDLKWLFAFLASAEMTPAENYNQMMELLEKDEPNYEAALLLIDTAEEALNVDNIEEAIAEMRALKNAANQLKAVIASGEIKSGDGYSREEIQQTVGLIFDLGRTNFSMGTVVEEEETYHCIYSNFYSSTISDLQYTVTYLSNGGEKDKNYGGSSVNSMNANLYDKFDAYGYQDNASRESSASNVYAHLVELHNSLKLGELDQAISGLYVGHWEYWEEHIEEYELLKEEVAAQKSQKEAFETTLKEKQAEYNRVSKDEEKQEEAESILENIRTIEAKLQPMLDKEAEFQALIDEKIYAEDDERLETIGTVLEETIEAARQATLWSIAYYACDGKIADDAYYHMLEVANSSEYTHPRSAYETLCNYGVNPPEELAQMVISYEKLEKSLLFLQRDPEETGAVGWSELEAELHRIFGNITHSYTFAGYCQAHQDEKGDTYSHTYYSNTYSVENIQFPSEVIENIRKEIPPYEASVCKFEKCAADSSESKSSKHITHLISYSGDQPWEQALGLLDSICANSTDGYEYGSAEYTLEEQPIRVNHSTGQTESFRFEIGIGVGSEKNFNESGLTVRQNRFQKAQKTISEYQQQMIASTVNMDQEMVNLLMQIIAGQENVSLNTISDYLENLKQPLKYGKEMMRQAVLAMAASDYANDELYQSIYSGNLSEDAGSLIQKLRQGGFDGKVLNALDERKGLLDEQERLLNESAGMLSQHQDSVTGAWKTEQVSSAEAIRILSPVLDVDSLVLYGYVEEKTEEEPKEEEEKLPPNYLRTVLYAGAGAPKVQLEGNQATIGDQEPITIFGDVYLSVERSFSGKLLAWAKSQVETYHAPEGSISAEDIVIYENGTNRKSYAIGGSTLNLCTVDESYAVTTGLWTYTGNTSYISAGNELTDLYGYCIDLALRTNVEGANLMLQIDPANRISSAEDANTETAMGAGSYMEFTTMTPLYPLEQAKKYMSCLRVTITDTNTGYIYGYGSLDMSDASVTGSSVTGATIKAPLRLYDKDTGVLLQGNEGQYLCSLTKNAVKNLTVYVYLDGAKVTDAMASAYDGKSMQGALNLQFTTDTVLYPADITNGIKGNAASDAGN